ncbi:iron complex transport system permease protein [Aeromicrobium sp. SORGH_AS981]|uniref:FecCD family ABC transporter permease n=1 Tax=Aeromicrobium sp. SORGH_AS_0981 TaxID=3041802 RepID=UPI00285CDB25|nr:iron ABC transporter permease [Aeromicrobium sp. SORGH_AS_0981]MDR6118932.1 iron complex transport system permease protein [Aeromicrobium sp. SORGH_AS_0981]
MRRGALLLGLVVVLACTAALSVVLGVRANEVSDVWDVLTGRGDEYLGRIVEARVPRTVVGAVVGAALAVAGLLIQAVTRNPLAEPGLLGVSMGASAAIVTATAFLELGAGTATVWVAIPGALVAVAVVYALGRRAGGESVVPLILAGAVVSAVLGAYVQAMILTRPDAFDSYRFWVVGSLAGVRWETLAMVAPVMLVGLLLTVLVAPGLNTVQLGDAVATSLGVRVVWVRFGALAAATLLAAAATAAAGPIVFVGLAVPHVARALVASDLRWQVPVALLLGAALLVGSDVLARVVARPTELMVGVVTAFLGAPFLLAAVRRTRLAA